MDSSIVQIKTYKGKVFFSIGCVCCKDLVKPFLEVLFPMASNTQGSRSLALEIFLQFKFATGNAKIACINVTFCARVEVAAVLGQLLHPQVCPRLQHYGLF